jgi:hypothetical protein
MRVVHVRVRRVDFAKSLGEMRQWLDRHNRPLVRFDTEADGGTITIKVQFDSDDLPECRLSEAPAARRTTDTRRERPLHTVERRREQMVICQALLAECG